MGVLKEYRCVAHDHEFDAIVEQGQHPECPFGCSPRFVIQEFRTPIGIRHAGTTTTDIMARQLAADYGMTDMRNDKDGSSVMSSTSVNSGGARRSFEPFQRAKWEPSIVAPAQLPVYRHPDTMPGTKTNMQQVLDAKPSNLLRAKTVFQKPK